MTFVLAHLSDPHIGTPQWPRPREAFSKVGLEEAFWHFGRRRSFNMRLLERMVEDLKRQATDHVAVTGDVVNAGLSSEFSHSGNWMSQLRETYDLSFVPGNHDATTSHSATKMQAAFSPWMTGDGQAAGEFPYLKVRGPLALVGLSSAVPSPTFYATGLLGGEQLEKAALLLKDTQARQLCRVILIHHPPVAIKHQRRRGLVDHDMLDALIQTCGAELVLHGHQHESSLVHLRTPTGDVPVVGAPCASANPCSGQSAAGYNLFTFVRHGAGWSIEMRARRIDHATDMIVDDARHGWQRP
jgi:3',5'-cyclic AMP phosphodiesterase CpdA